MERKRILWISGSGCYIPVHKRKLGYNGGSWATSIQKELLKRNDIELACAFCKDGEPPKVIQNGVTYYVVPNHKKSRKDKIIDLVKIKDVTRDEILWPYYEEKFKAIIDDFRPDVIHIFGSELYQSLAALVTGGIPTILHIQGILSECIYNLLPPSVSKWQYINSGKGLGGKYHNFQLLAYWNRSVHREKAIMKAVPNVIGRTEWDKSVSKILNPHVHYYYGGEILRECFYEPSDRKIPSKPTITTTISVPLYKGFDLILKVANILKNEMHLDFIWNVYGNVDASFTEKHTGLHHQDVNVNLCGVASAEELRSSLLNSTLYFHSSYIENSPNAVCEAQILGLPVVASRVGGTDSMVEHGKTGFLYPVTDPYMAASYIGRMIEDKEENVKIGKQAREVALVRHDKEKIVEELLKTYHEIEYGTK